MGDEDILNILLFFPSYLLFKAVDFMLKGGYLRGLELEYHPFLFGSIIKVDEVVLLALGLDDLG